jgi:dTDP-glucose pyrophosphorylase
MRAIIPCAGFGTRMGMHPHESKELLPDENGEPLIKWTLDLCKEFGLAPFVILREEKKDLMEYCGENKVSYQVVIPEGEWTTTVLKSAPYWDTHNFLLLPDTRFMDCWAIKRMIEHLKLGCAMTLGTHTVADPSKWGVIENYYVREKNGGATSKTAWGVIGFQGDSSSKTFFQDLATRGSARLHDASFTPLGLFADLTRGK